LKANNKLQTNTAIIAYAQNFPDALAISSWAAQNGVPILLSETNYLPDTTKNALADLGISKTIITGGTGVISAAVESQLPEATRYGGGDRYDTAVKIIQGLGQDIDTVYLATGSNFPDALAGSALAAKQGKAILLVNNQMNLYVSDFLQAKIGTIHKMVVLGGNGVVTVSSLDQIVKVASGIVEETPAEAVSKALEAIKVLNEEEANKYFSYEEFVNYNNSAGTGVNEEQYAALLFNKLSYKILSSSVSGETAKARVEITTTDMGAVFQEYMEQTIQLAIENALKPEDQQLSEEELGKQAEQILIGILQKNDNQLITTTVDISLTKNNNSWKITMDKDLADALLGGLIKWIENLGAATL
jgi:putative cell wall-binding protein